MSEWILSKGAVTCVSDAGKELCIIFPFAHPEHSGLEVGNLMDGKFVV
jgi:hypothetical protein